MKQKICPTCDGKLNGNYCPFCHKIVRNPLEWDVQYYLNERHPDWETNCEYHSRPKRLETEGSGNSFSANPETVFQNGNPEPEFDNPYRTTVSKADKPREKKHKKRGTVGKVLLIVAGSCVIVNIMAAIIANISYEKVPEPLPSAEAFEDAADSAVLDVSEETEISISEEVEWDIVELSDEEVMERCKRGLGDRCDSYSHFPVSYEEFSDKIEDHLAKAGLPVDFVDEYTVNLLYPSNEQTETFSSYNRTVEWYVLEPGMEETDYGSGVSLSSDTASGEIHWFEVNLNDREQAFQTAAWAAQTIGELAGFSNAKETAEQIYTELSAFEGGEEFWYMDISEYSVSAWEYEGTTEVRLELSYDFEQKNSLD